MMDEKFKNGLVELIKEIVRGSNSISDNTIDKLKQCYYPMPYEERRKNLEEIFLFTDGDYKLYVFLLSYLLQIFKERVIVEIIEDVLLDARLDLLDSIVIFGQLQTWLFTHVIQQELKTSYFRKRKIYQQQLQQLDELVGLKQEYIPYSKRNTNRILLMISPILGEKHAPTRRMVNLYHYLVLLGYEVYVYATSYRHIQLEHADCWWKLMCSNELWSESGQFQIEYYNVAVRGYHICYYDDTYIEETGNALLWIQQFNPLFIWTIGDGNYLAELCNRFTTVVTMGCVNTPPLTEAPVVARYFKCDESKKLEYEICLKSNQVIFDVVTMDIFDEQNEIILSRNEYDLSEDDFVIMIAGNRLDQEVSDEFLNILYQMLEDDSHNCIVLVGKCSKLKSAVEKSKYESRIKFLGYTEHFKEVISLADVFLNPPRVGGGTGGVYAVLNEVPIITLGGCDVATIGEDFICDSIEQMPDIVRRYRVDIEYMEMQRAYCKTIVSQWNNLNNEKNIRSFCANLEGYIQQNEDMLKCDKEYYE